MVGKKRGNSGSLGPSGGRACPGVSGPACAYGRLRVCAGFAPAGRIPCALGAQPRPPGLCLIALLAARLPATRGLPRCAGPCAWNPDWLRPGLTCGPRHAQACAAVTTTPDKLKAGGLPTWEPAHGPAPAKLKALVGHWRTPDLLPVILVRNQQIWSFSCLASTAGRLLVKLWHAAGRVSLACAWHLCARAFCDSHKTPLVADRGVCAPMRALCGLFLH